MSLNIINRFVFVIEMNCVICDVLNELTFHYILYHLQVSNGQEALHYIWGMKYRIPTVTVYFVLHITQAPVPIDLYNASAKRHCRSTC